MPVLLLSINSRYWLVCRVHLLLRSNSLTRHGIKFSNDKIYSANNNNNNRRSNSFGVIYRAWIRICPLKLKFTSVASALNGWARSTIRWAVHDETSALANYCFRCEISKYFLFPENLQNGFKSQTPHWRPAHMCHHFDLSHTLSHCWRMQNAFVPSRSAQNLKMTNRIRAQTVPIQLIEWITALKQMPHAIRMDRSGVHRTREIWSQPELLRALHAAVSHKSFKWLSINGECRRRPQPNRMGQQKAYTDSQMSCCSYFILAAQDV